MSLDVSQTARRVGVGVRVWWHFKDTMGIFSGPGTLYIYYILLHALQYMYIYIFIYIHII